MSITTTAVRNRHTTTGTGPFSFSFYVDSESDLNVFIESSSGSVRTLVLNTDYVVSGVRSSTGGTVTLQNGESVGTGEALMLERAESYTQETDYRAQSRVNTETVESSLDTVVRQVQQVADSVSRCPELGDTDVDGSGAYNANGNRISNLAEPVDGSDAATKNYADSIGGGGGSSLPLIYTSGTLPAASESNHRIWAIVRDASEAERLVMCLRKADGTTYGWATLATAPF